MNAPPKPVVDEFQTTLDDYASELETTLSHELGNGHAHSHAQKTRRSSLSKGNARPRRAASPRSKAHHEASERLSSVIAKTLATIAKKAADRVAQYLNSRGVEKAASSDDLDEALRIALEDVGADFADMVAPTEDELKAAAQDGGEAVLAQFGVGDRDELVNQFNEKVSRWAHNRAAELVGMRYDESGNLIENPDPKWAITDYTREALRDTISAGLDGDMSVSAMTEAITDSFGFSPERARMIARTETIRAQNAGAMISLRDTADATGADIGKEWLLGDDPCEICEDNADDGVIDLEDDFSSGDEAPPAHPRCRCAVTGVRQDDEDSADKAAKTIDQGAGLVSYDQGAGRRRKKKRPPKVIGKSDKDDGEEIHEEIPLSPYNHDNGRDKILLDQVQEVIDTYDDADPESWPVTKVRTDELLATRSYGHPEDAPPVFGKGWDAHPVIAHTPDGQYHILDGHHDLARAIRKGKGKKKVWLFEVAGETDT